MTAARILVVDDDLASRGLMEQVLAEDGHQVVTCGDGAEAIRILAQEPDAWDAVVSDIRMVEADGLEVLDWTRKNAVETPVLLVTAFGNVDGAVDAIRRGAYDYISKPYDVAAIKLVVDRALRHRRLAAENRRLKREIREKYSLQNVIGRSEGMLQVYKTAARVALTDATVLVAGESGTGKELVARAIHTASGRSAWPNSSLSSTPSAMALQSTAMNGPALRADAVWIARATSSLPVPLSPATSTVASVSATRAAVL